MAVSGLPTRCANHAVNIATLAVDMIDIVQEVNAGGKKMQVMKPWTIYTYILRNKKALGVKGFNAAFLFSVDYNWYSLW